MYSLRHAEVSPHGQRDAIIVLQGTLVQSQGMPVEQLTPFASVGHGRGCQQRPVHGVVLVDIGHILEHVIITTLQHYNKYCTAET